MGGSSFVCCNGACNSCLFPTKKLTSNETLELDSKGTLCLFFLLYSFCFHSVIYNTNGPIEQTYQRPSFYNEHIVWGNSDIKWMKVSVINSNVNKYLSVVTSWLTFCEGLKFIKNCFNRLHVNQLNDTFATTNSFQ